MDTTKMSILGNGMMRVIMIIVLTLMINLLLAKSGSDPGEDPVLSSPVLLYPNHNSNYVDTGCTFQWSYSGETPDAFRLCLKKGMEDWETIDVGNVTTFKSQFPLVYNCNYQWKVVAYKEGSDDAESSEWTFSTTYGATYGGEHAYHAEFDQDMPDGWHGDFYLSDNNGIDGSQSVRAALSGAQKQADLSSIIFKWTEKSWYCFFYSFTEDHDYTPYVKQDGDKLEIFASYDLGSSYQLHQTINEWSPSYQGRFAFDGGWIDDLTPETDVFLLFKVTSGGSNFYIDIDQFHWVTESQIDNVKLDPDTIEFFLPLVGETSTFTCYLKHEKNYIEIKEISIEGDDASEFSMMFENEHDNTVNVPIIIYKKTIHLRISFTPKIEGQYNATLKIVDILDRQTNIPIIAIAYHMPIHEPPYYMDFDGEEIDLLGWAVMGADPVSPGDPKWDFGSDPLNNNNILLYAKARGTASAIMSPPISLRAGQEYDFMVNYRNTAEGEFCSFQMGYVLATQMSDFSIITYDNITGVDWRVARISVTPDEDSNYQLGIVVNNDNTDGTLFLDNFRVMPRGIDEARVFGSLIQDDDVATYKVRPSAILHPETREAHFPWVDIPSMVSSGKVEGVFEWNSPDVGFSAKGLSVLLQTKDGTSFSGTSMTIYHKLGFVPDHIAVRIGNGGYEIINKPDGEGWTDECIIYSSPSSKAGEQIRFVFPRKEGATLPVVFASFTAIPSAGQKIKVEWTTHSETGMRGFHVFRASSLNLVNAMQVSPLIPAHNSSQTQQYMFTDDEFNESGDYYYWLKCDDLNGTVSYHGPCSAYLNLEHNPNTPELPLITELKNPWPNPFNPETRIQYSIERDCRVLLEVYNLKGQKVVTLVDNILPAGNYQYNWNARVRGGQNLGSGIYLLRLKAGAYTKTVKIAISK